MNKNHSEIAGKIDSMREAYTPTVADVAAVDAIVSPPPSYTEQIARDRCQEEICHYILLDGERVAEVCPDSTRPIRIRGESVHTPGSKLNVYLSDEETASVAIGILQYLRDRGWLENNQRHLFGIIAELQKCLTHAKVNGCPF